MNLFGKRRSPDDQLKSWLATLRKECRSIDSEIRTIEREQNKLKLQIKTSAKKNDVSSAKIMAKAIARSNKSIERLHANKAQINSVAMQLKEEQATLKVAGAMQQSSKILEGISRLLSIPKISAITRQMAKEMEKAGLISEMLVDQFEMIQDDVEEDADEEATRVLEEVLSGKLSQVAVASREIEKPEVETDFNMESLQKRMQELG